ncbi:hypothetical protein [Pannonibacter carbonis]|nr:hypothetical protein [Pannonibacter carbonis]
MTEAARATGRLWLMTNLDLSEVIPAKRSAEPGPESSGLYNSMS